MKKDTIPLLVRNFRHHASGRCTVCGRLSFFFCRDRNDARNMMWCLTCRSSSRKRLVAKLVLETFFPGCRSVREIPGSGVRISILNADINDQFAKILLPAYDGFVCSELIDGAAAGTQVRERVYSQDIQRMTFADASFDLVVTEEVLEHVRNDDAAFTEIRRVLKPGGVHIFTVPFQFDAPTLTRVDTSTGKDIHLLPPEYHGDFARGKILAYRTFGYDMFERLAAAGFETTIRVARLSDAENGIFDCCAFVSRKRTG